MKALTLAGAQKAVETATISGAQEAVEGSTLSVARELQETEEDPVGLTNQDPDGSAVQGPESSVASQEGGGGDVVEMMMSRSFSFVFLASA